MAKSYKATWLGDGSPEAQMVTVGGVRFIKGEAVTVKDDLAENGMNWGGIIRDNPMFSIDADDEDVNDAADEDAEKNALKEQLRALGVETRGNQSLESLRSKLASATK